jgi:hypothetical protein
VATVARALSHIHHPPPLNQSTPMRNVLGRDEIQGQRTMRPGRMKQKHPGQPRKKESHIPVNFGDMVYYKVRK